MDLAKKLSKIQQDIKAPKNLYNNFGNFKYRNAESILEAFKPFEAIHGVILIVSDEIVPVGDKVYIKSTAKLIDCETKEEISATAFAREPDDRKGMDDSQITGATSSYARKYALNGLFLLDDSKDADSNEYKDEADKKSKRDGKEGNARAAKKRKEIESLCKSHCLSPKDICKANGKDWDGADERTLDWMIASLRKKFGEG